MDAYSQPSTESPPARSTILSSFLRGRPRGSSQSGINSHNLAIDTQPRASPSPPPTSNHRRSSPMAAHSPQQGGGLNQFSNMLRRRRSANAVNPPAAAGASPVILTASPSTASPAVPMPIPTSSGSRIRLVPHLDSRRSLRFEPISRTLSSTDPPLRIGRFTDRTGLGAAALVTSSPTSNKLAFKSKVVSRAHAEISVGLDGKFYIKDTKSSSGTFLNHVRLSPASLDSRPFVLRDGDVIQLGVDYQGGTEDIYKSVKIRVEVGAGRDWQTGTNAFNTAAANNLKQLTALSGIPVATGIPGRKKGKKNSNAIPDCCICLFSISIHQALFIAPCSHTFHYKCLRPLLEQHFPAFSCPLCRTFADLEEDVEVDNNQNDLDEFESDEDEVPVSASAPVLDKFASIEEGDGNENGENEFENEHDAASPLFEHAPTSGMTTAGYGTLTAVPGSSMAHDRDRGAETEVEDMVVVAPMHRSINGSTSANNNTNNPFRVIRQRQLIDLREDDSAGDEEDEMNVDHDVSTVLRGLRSGGSGRGGANVYGDDDVEEADEASGSADSGPGRRMDGVDGQSGAAKRKR